MVPVISRFEDFIRLAITFSNEVLPDPEPPIMAITEPAGIESEMFCRIGFLLLTLTFSISDAFLLLFFVNQFSGLNLDPVDLLT